MRDLYATQKWEEEQKRMEIEKGRAEGRAEGRAQGRAEGKLEIAKNLLAMGIPMDKVVQASGLTEEQISALMNQKDDKIRSYKLEMRNQFPNQK